MNDTMPDTNNDQFAITGEARALLAAGPWPDSDLKNAPMLVMGRGSWHIVAHEDAIMIAWAPFDGSEPVVVEFPADVTFLEVAQRLGRSTSPTLRHLFEIQDRTR